MSNVFFYEPFYDFDRFFDEALGQRRVPGNTSPNGLGRQLQRRAAEGDGAVRHFKPRMDLHEDTEKNLVTATFELPGLKKEDVNIDINNGRLTVNAESAISSSHEQTGYAVRERHFGKLSRTLQLPTGVKEGEIKARMEDGVLTVTFPKTSPELAPRKIAIS
ncbi:small heat shock protein [Coprinopsis marcescibilis]|uniref:Small heat shock protein n=1 Tax=Coprinopsis marcescibilis TaxID=230819 RepID=A0A5C3L062_COPMA|nr:small heat shock protein [Coprinopsis marcescibilis]